ncbi:GPP34 family phosphoprotein [Streptomyces phytohabitans]|uniref:GOLPH3/VPS74 family protein n=1 Tax=Streptomyces phytohabitans TaxID=1150371 RepID=UPI00345B5B35
MTPGTATGRTEGGAGNGADDTTDEGGTVRDETLIVEDLTLLMLDDETGVPAGAATLHYALGGAVLVELALLGRLVTADGPAGPNGPEVRPAGTGPLPDPLLQAAYEQVAERPRRVQPLLLHVGVGLHEAVLDRLLARGMIRRESRKVLGLFRTTRLPVDDVRHEEALRDRVCAVLERGESPDARTAAVVALLSASGTLPSLHPRPKWSSEVIRRAKELEEGHWGAGAVGTAVARTALGVAVASTAATVTAVT